MISDPGSAREKRRYAALFFPFSFRSQSTSLLFVSGRRTSGEGIDSCSILVEEGMKTASGKRDEGEWKHSGEFVFRVWVVTKKVRAIQATNGRKEEVTQGREGKAGEKVG